MRRVLLLLALTPACGRPDRFEDGDICVDPGVVAEFAAGDAITFEVVFDDCISACARRVKTSCDVQVDGDDIFLDASGSFLPPGPGACVALCAVLSARCEVNDLSPGTYTVHHGDQQLVVTLPSSEAPDQPVECGFFGP